MKQAYHTEGVASKITALRCLQAIDAKRAAAEEVERLLQHPEDLKRLSGLLEDYTQKHQVSVISPNRQCIVSNHCHAGRRPNTLL